MRIAGMWVDMSKRSVTYWQATFPVLTHAHTGVLTPGKNNRMILANTEQLHDRIDLIMTRNRELETPCDLCKTLSLISLILYSWKRIF